MIADMHSSPATVDASTLFPITLDLPAPPSSLGHNGRAHWRQRASDYAQYRDHAAWLLIDRFGRDITPYTGLVVLDVTWRAQHRWLPDTDGANERCAAYRDAFQVAGIIADDAQVGIGTVHCEAVPNRVARVVVTLRVQEDACP